MVNKKRIQSHFARAAATYDRQAVIQRRVAERLISLLDPNCMRPPRRVLEIGCCTGMLTERLLQKYREINALFVNDIVPEFRTMVLPRLPGDCNPVFLAGDIESIDLPPDLDLVISSSTFHWLEDLPALLAKLAVQMSPEGTLCFTIYSTGNFHELREITGTGLDYYSAAGLQTLVEQHFTVLSCEEEMITFYFDDPLHLLHHLRETGVNALDTPALTRSRLNEFTRAYAERFGCREGVPLTYHPVYCTARKT